jgi:hypothetical protein
VTAAPGGQGIRSTASTAIGAGFSTSISSVVRATAPRTATATAKCVMMTSFSPAASGGCT